jgi:hypothetical protein
MKRQHGRLNKEAFGYHNCGVEGERWRLFGKNLNQMKPPARKVIANKFKLTKLQLPSRLQNID